MFQCCKKKIVVKVNPPSIKAVEPRCFLCSRQKSLIRMECEHIICTACACDMRDFNVDHCAFCLNLTKKNLSIKPY